MIERLKTAMDAHRSPDSGRWYQTLKLKTPRDWGMDAVPLIRSIGWPAALRVYVIILICVSALAQVALAQGAVPAEIVVTGKNTRSVERYVDQAARAETGRQIARWNVPVCLSITGFAPAFAQAIDKRFREIALSAGIRVMNEGCSPNTKILLRDDADNVARDISVHRGLYSDDRNERGFLDRKLKAAWLKARTVRWLSVTQTMNDDGSPFVYDKGGNRVASSMSLVGSNTEEDVVAAIAIVDAARLKGVTLRQLSDYLTFVILARPNIREAYKDPGSILSLFDGPSPPLGLTARDNALLASLYFGSAAQPVRVQRAALTRRIQARLGAAIRVETTDK